MTTLAQSPLTALSPLDGRYAARVAALRPLMSEFGLMHRRVQVEVEWFIALSDAGFAEFKPLSEAARGLLRSLVARFSEADAQAIKDIERTTNHDVKAVEYWIKGRLEANAELKAAGEFVHFACTSEDINNTSHALMLKAARAEVMLPPMPRVLRPATLVITAFIRRGTLATMPVWMREMSGLYGRPAVQKTLDAAVTLPLKVSYRILAMNARLQLLLLKLLSPNTVEVAGRALLGIAPLDPATTTPQEAQARLGFDTPRDAHRELRAKQHARVLGEGIAPSDEGLVESQPILGAVR